MGCTASRVASEDTVRRCKERRRLMKEAVLSRHHVAAAHADYVRALRLTGSTLTRFASFQSLSVSDQTPPVLLHTPLPPPPLPSFPPAPSLPPSSPSAQSAASMPPHDSTPRSHTPMPFVNFPTTPSQASSAWNWEAHYPPSPPGSDYYDRLEQQRSQLKDPHEKSSSEDHHLPEEADEEEEGDEIRCSDWGERRSISSSTSRSEPAGNEDNATAARSEWRGSSVGRELQVVVRHRDLKEIVAAIEECFVKAAAAGEAMSGLLENGREQLERGFRQLKKTVYHSSSVFSHLSSTWTSRPPLAIKYRLDVAALEDEGRGKSHCSTLEQLLAWEKKLYEEVKAKEAVKIEHKRKLSTLQTQECKGKDETKLIKTKAAIQRLQSLILVTSQAVSATSSAIIRVRDDELAPQLVELCLGFLNMWRSMNRFHEVQNHIVQQVRGLTNYSVAIESTSDLHRQATRELESAVSDWHSSFSRLIKFHRDYIRSLYAWLKLTLIDVGNEGTEKDLYSSLVSSELSVFCDEWKQALDRLPDTVAAEALKSFVNVVHSISVKQAEELKVKKRLEICSKQLEKKSIALRSIERKFYQSYSSVGIAYPGVESSDHGQIFDARDPLAEKKIEVAAYRRKVEDEMSKHTKAIGVTRDITLNNIQTGLPGVFQAMAGFSGLFTEALEGVCRHAHPQKL